MFSQEIFQWLPSSAHPHHHSAPQNTYHTQLLIITKLTHTHTLLAYLKYDQLLFHIQSTHSVLAVCYSSHLELLLT